MRVAFLLQDLQLSGGVGVVVQHAVHLRRDHGVEVALVVTRPSQDESWAYPGLDELELLSVEDAAQRSWDLAVSSWWETNFSLFRLDAARHVSFVQLMEDSTYEAGTPERLGAAMTTALPVTFITEARWIAALLADLQPGAPVHYVPNGVDKEAFPLVASPDPLDGPLRIVVEGSSEYVQKGVADALRATSMMSEPAHVTWVSPHPVTRPDGVDELHCALSHREFADVLSKSHVLLKLSRAEGMYGPPLEGFHRGCTVVTTPVTGHDEYVRHRENGLVNGWDDLHGTARALDLLARDRGLLDDLRRGALQTASEWPGWPEAAGRMAETLQAIAADPPPDGRGAGLRLASDIQTAIDDVEFASWRAESAMDVYKDLRGQKAVRGALKLRRMLKR